MTEEINQEINQEVEQKRETLKLPEKKEEVLDLQNMSEEEKAKAALAAGHIPKEDFKGDISRWKDPETFLKETYEKLPGLKNVVKNQQKVIQTQNIIIKKQQEDSKRLERQLEEERANIARKMRDSINEGNLQDYHDLQEKNKRVEEDLRLTQERTRELTQLNSEHEAEENLENKAVSFDDQIATQSWLSQNPMYKVRLEDINSQEELNFRKEADKIFNNYRSAYPTTPLSQIYKAVDYQLQQNGLKKQNAGLYNYSPPNNNKITKTRDYNSLTPEAKRVCDKFAAYGVDKEAYLANLDDESFTWFKS